MDNMYPKTIVTEVEAVKPRLIYMVTLGGPSSESCSIEGPSDQKCVHQIKPCLQHMPCFELATVDKWGRAGGVRWVLSHVEVPHKYPLTIWKKGFQLVPEKGLLSWGVTWGVFTAMETMV